MQKLDGSGYPGVFRKPRALSPAEGDERPTGEILSHRLKAPSGIMAPCFACAKPVVASPLPAFIETITRLKGGLIADAIIRLLKDEKLYGETSRNIRNYVKKTS